jgi:hypothetical protein
MANVVVLGGAIANKYASGGETWVRMSWALGLRRLGFDVYFVEQILPAACINAGGKRVPFQLSASREYFRAVAAQFGLAERAALICTSDDGQDVVETEGLTWNCLLDLAASASLLVNISGHLTLEPLLRRLRRKAYIDIDPGFTQFWHNDPATAFRVAGHDFYFTIGENIGSPYCPIPTGGIPWRPIRQPVVLDDWPIISVDKPDRFTTVASWRGAFGPVQFGGQSYGLKVHEFRKVLPLPRSVRRLHQGAAFEIALDIHPNDDKDRAALQEHGWNLVDPGIAAGNPDAFRRYVQGSSAEFSVAQGIYVDPGSGWFSDRTTRYLASGKPALVQETGFSRNIRCGDGLVPFRTLQEALDGALRIVRDYPAHCRAARSVAEDYFDSDRVIGRLIDEIGLP